MTLKALQMINEGKSKYSTLTSITTIEKLSCSINCNITDGDSSHVTCARVPSHQLPFEPNVHHCQIFIV